MPDNWPAYTHVLRLTIGVYTHILFVNCAIACQGSHAVLSSYEQDMLAMLMLSIDVPVMQVGMLPRGDGEPTRGC